MKYLSQALAVSLIAAAFAACGGSTAQQEPATPDAAPAVEIPDTWDEESMSHDQQVAFMKMRVVPKMGAVFAEHEGEFDCKVCHGPDNKKPSEFLPELTLKDGAITEFQDNPEVSQFMAEKVVPAMADALGVAPYNVETHEGFGCGGCHKINML